MALSWSTRRQLLYYAVASVVGAVLLFFVWEVFFTRTPTCSDGVQNGTELGVDCGGSCQRICQSQTRSPVVMWARSFRTSDTTHTAAAYVSNPNTGAGARQVPYSFQLFDAQNVLVAQKDGVMDLPPLATIPVVEVNIDTGTRAVARTLFSFAERAVWNNTEAPAKLRLTGQMLAPDASRLSATLLNDSVTAAGNTSVVAVLFDSEGIARAASKTTIGTIAGKSSQPIIFTWPGGVGDIVRAEVTILTAF